jgi:phosphoribosylaminoimidazole-succinocarboxamide synthase
VQAEIPFWPVRRGKVRDVFDTGKHLLIVASDRISAYDSILATGIPLKGRVLTQLSLFWFEFLKSVTPTHLVTADVLSVDKRPENYAAQLAGRSMLVRKASVIPVECVVRGYLSGSGWRSYRQSGEICGHKLPNGLKESDKLPEPIFTPTTKADVGHDENITFEETVAVLGRRLAETVRDRTIEIYSKAAEYARTRGVIIADTKFEFGTVDNEVILIDEVLTPDSSRFWPADDYEPGRPQRSYDKQYVRDWLDASGWDHQPPAPGLPDDVTLKTVEKYVEAYERLTGATFSL